MFQNLIQQSLVYVLDKDKLTLSTGRVVEANKPFTQLGMAPLPGSTMKLLVDVEGKSMEFNNIPCGSSMATYGNTVISDDRQTMLTEVESLHKSMKNIVDNIDYYHNAVSAYDKIIGELNPQFAKDKQREDEIKNLQSELSSIKDMLSKVLNNNN